MNIRTLYSSKRRHLLVLLLPLVALLVVALAVGSLTVLAFGDLVVTFKSGSEPPTTTKAGTSHSFSVEVTNNGTTDPPAEAVVFEYRAPAGVVITDISSDGPCEVGTEGDPSDPAICSLGNIAGETHTVDITVYVLPDVPHGTLLDHDVRAWQFGTEENPPDNENHAFVTVEAEADLSVEKTSEGDVVIGYDTNTFQDIITPTLNTVTAGELLKYIVTVTNDGPSDAQKVVLTDTLPAKFDFLYSVPAGCWANAADPLFITCLLGTMPATTTQQLELVVRTRPDAAIDDPDDGDNVRTATNNVQVSSDTDDPTTPNTFDLPVTVNARANLRVTKTDIPDPVLAGEEVTYIITAKNLGPSKARTIDITDTLPSGLVFVRCEPVDPDEVPVCSYDPANNTVTLTDFRIDGLLRDDLMPDEERSFRIVAYARSNLVKEPDIYGQPDAVGNLVTITDTVEIAQATDITDWYEANNTDHELTGVTSQADLAVTKTDVPDPTPDDGYITYDPVTNSFVYTYYLTIENLGPSDAGRVVLTDTLPIYASLDMVDSDPLTAITTTGSLTGALDIRFRDDGVVIVDWGQIAGNDGRRDDVAAYQPPQPTNPSLPVTRTLTIRVRVDADVAPDIGFLENRVEVRTVAGDLCPTQTGTLVCPDLWPHGYTPTPDPNLSNNVLIEQTLLVSPEVKVDKKVYVRRSPARGIDVTTDGLTEVERCAAYAADDILTLPGDELTYCYTITNEGDTWFHSITLEDLSDALIYRAPLGRFEVAFPGQAGQPPLRGDITWDPVSPGGDTNEAQTITIATTEPEVAVLAPKGIPDPDGYDHILIIRTFTVDFPELGPIAGVVWEDTNGNHVVDLNEPLSAGVAVDLLNESGTQVLSSKTTGADGRYAFHNVAPGRYIVRILGDFSPVIEFDLYPSSGYSIANFDRLISEWYIESEEYEEPIFRMLGTNRARVDVIPSTKYSTPLPGIEPFGDDYCDNLDPDLVCDTDLLHDTLALPVLEETTKEWDIHDDNDGDGLPSPLDIIEYTVDIPNTGIIEATGVWFYDGLFNYIHDNPEHPWVPATLINGSVSAAIHVYGREPITGREIDADVQPPDLAFGEDLLLRTYAPAIGGGYLELTYLSAIVLDEEIELGNNAGDDEIRVDTRLAIPPIGYLLRFDGVAYDPPIPVTFSLRITYQVRIKETVQVDTIILNHGWVWYNEIDLFDERFPDFDPTDPDLYFNSNRLANNHAGTPARAWETIEFPGWPEVPEGVEPTNYEGPRFDDYAWPGAPVRDDDDPTWFKVEREAPSIATGTRIQLPVLTFVADNDEGVEMRAEIQNVGVKKTTGIMFVWGEYSRQCPNQDPGPIKVECLGEVEPGSAWVMDTLDLPEGAKSGILYSVSLDPLPDGFTRPNPDWPYPYPGETIDQYLCEAGLYDADGERPGPEVSWKEWQEYWDTHPEFWGTWLGTEVIRTGPGNLTPGVRVSGAYEGLSRAMEGVYDPKSGGYAYYAPVVQGQASGFTTWLYVQNSGLKCTSVELWLYQRDNCMRPSVCQIHKLAPGETYQLDVTTCPGIREGFEGSAYIRASQPLGIVVDQVGRDLLLTHLAVPASLTHQNDWPPYFTAGSFVNYGPLIYREYQGWDTRLYVQNLSSTVNAKVKVYFLDNSGDIITTIVDWICPRGSQSYFLPVISDLAGHYIGAVRVESQDWWTPGDPPVDSPYILSVAELIRYEGPARAVALEGLAYNLFGEDEAFDWQVGEITTWGVGLIAIPSLNRWGDEVTTELAIQNVVPKPGKTDFAIYIYDQNGVIDYVCQTLNQKQVEYINLDTWGIIPAYFEGSAVISATHWQHEGSGSWGLAAVKVERIGTVLSHDIPGDESTGTRGFPLHRPFTFLRPEDVPECP